MSSCQSFSDKVIFSTIFLVLDVPFGIIRELMTSSFHLTFFLSVRNALHICENKVLVSKNIQYLKEKN